MAGEGYSSGSQVKVVTKKKFFLVLGFDLTLEQAGFWRGGKVRYDVCHVFWKS